MLQKCVSAAAVLANVDVGWRRTGLVYVRHSCATTGKDLTQGVGDVECIHLLQNEDQGRAVVNAVMNFHVAHETGSYHILWS